MIKDITVDSNGKRLAYRNDTNWRDPHQKLALQPEHIKEFKKCFNNPVYFIETYIKFNDPNKGLSTPKLYNWQKDFIKKVLENRYIVANIPRQSGKSTTLAFLLCWYMCFNNDKDSAIVANKLEIAKEIFNRVVKMMQLVPHFLKPAPDAIGKTYLWLNNGCRLLTSATTESGMSGYTINGILLMDEISKIQSDLYYAFINAMAPTIARAAESKLVRISTPLGMNHWYTVVQKAKDPESDEAYMEILWNQIPGRDEKFKKDIIDKFGYSHWLQEYECVTGDTIIAIKHKKTNEIRFIPIINLFKNEYK